MSDTIQLTRVAPDTGAVIKPGPMVVAPPALVVTDKTFADVAKDAGLNGPFLADLVAAMFTHENMAINMYRALRTFTANPLLHAAFESFEQDSIAAVEIYGLLAQELGVPNHYVSPAGRMTEGLDSHMIMSLLESGSADAVTIDMKAVEMVMVGANMCVANTNLLKHIAGEINDDKVRPLLREAVKKLEGPQQFHLQWAIETRQNMATTMLKHPMGHKLAQFAENVIAKVKGIKP